MVHHSINPLVSDRPRRGAQPVTDPNHDHYPRSYALRNQFANVTQLQARLPDVKATRVSRLTIHNKLHCFDLNANKLLQVTPLMPRHHRELLQWAQDQVTWTMQQWSTLLFTDECCSLHILTSETS
uniref:Uncharacterized protein n=1 Tax=Oryzias sinensis TaxID=183150 RepID=A0A8C7Z9W2_9TELE